MIEMQSLSGCSRSVYTTPNVKTKYLSNELRAEFAISSLVLKVACHSITRPCDSLLCSLTDVDIKELKLHNRQQNIYEGFKRFCRGWQQHKKYQISVHISKDNQIQEQMHRYPECSLLFERIQPSCEEATFHYVDNFILISL